MDEQNLHELAKVYAASYASPHHITFTLDGLKALVAALSQPAAAGWIEWSGGAQPVADDIRVDVEFADGDIESGTVAMAWDWTHCEEEYDIVRYRVTKATP